MAKTSGRQRLNIHGAIDLETVQTHVLEAETVDAVSTIALFTAMEALYPTLTLIHLFLDNARYHHATLVRQWLARPSCRHQAPFHSDLLPASEPHRAPLGTDAQEHYAQSMLQRLRRFPNIHVGLPARHRAEKLARTLRFGQGQFPHYLSRQISGSHLNAV